jgi:hypothetical protein
MHSWAHQFSEAIFSHESREENYKARSLASYATTLEVGRSVWLIDVSLPKRTPKEKLQPYVLNGEK